MSNNSKEQLIFSSIVTEAGGFYSAILTIASSFLGGSLLFLEKITEAPNPISLYFLGLGWICLVFSIISIIFVRRRNLDSGWLALEGKYSEAKEIDSETRTLSNISSILLGVGLSLIMIFGMINVIEKTQETKKMSEEKKKNKTEIVEHSIPFGSISTTQDKPNNTETTNSTSSNDSGNKEGSKKAGK